MRSETEILDVSMHPITRKFSVTQIENEFLVAINARYQKTMFFGAISAVLAFLAYAGIVYYVADGKNPLTDRILYWLIPALISGIILLKSPLGKNTNAVNLILSLHTFWVAGWHNWSLIIEQPAGAGLVIGYGVNIIILVYIYLIFRPLFITSLIIGSVVTIAFIPSSLIVTLNFFDSNPLVLNELFWGEGNDLFKSPFLYQMAILAVVNLIGATAAYVLETLERENFISKKIIQSQRIQIESEREKSENLLLNVLPSSIAQRLKHEEGSIADRFNDLTVIFVDIVNFTKISSTASPESLIKMLNGIFTEFDLITQSFGIEKIKTIGDAYMAVSGAPEHSDKHAEIAAKAALRMLESASRFSAPDGTPLKVRIGISTGPAIAGIIGAHKFSYDLWGDTVNTAARMESSGEVGQIQVSESTYEILKDKFEFEERGIIEIKGKGLMRTWWLKSERV